MKEHRRRTSDLSRGDASENYAAGFLCNAMTGRKISSWKACFNFNVQYLPKSFLTYKILARILPSDLDAAEHCGKLLDLRCSR